MTRCNSFVRSLVFAALAAAGWMPWVVLVAPVFGSWVARALYFVAVVAAYVAGIAASPARGLILGAAVGAAGGVVLLLAPDTAQLAIILAAMLGAVRSGLLYRRGDGRTWLTELLLLGGGLLFGRSLASAFVFSTPLALWGFFLVQSLFFLSRNEARVPAGDGCPDPFEEAHTRAVALLERP